MRAQYSRMASAAAHVPVPPAAPHSFTGSSFLTDLPHQASVPQPLRSAARISLAPQHPGDGYHLHPAVTDACMQLGPMAGAAKTSEETLSPTSNSGTTPGPAAGSTRVVAGLAALQAGGGGAAGGAAAWAAGALGRPRADGSIASNHWVLGGALAIDGLLVRAARLRTCWRLLCKQAEARTATCYNPLAFSTKQSRCTLHITKAARYVPCE